MGMKRKYVAVLMGIMVATTSVPTMVYAEDSKTEAAADAVDTTDESVEADASGESSDESQENQESQENVVLGEVKSVSVSDSEITIAVGTMKEMGQPGDDGQNGGEPNSQGGEAPSDQDGEAPEKPEGDNQDGEAPSMLDLTGEEQTITVTADTVITKQAGGMQPGGDGQNSDAPEKPEGDDQSADSSDGEAPEKPEGDDQSADSSDGGAPEKSEGDDQSADSSDGGAPEKSEGDDQSADSSDGEAPEKPDGDARDGGAPEENGQSAEAEEISLSDIQEGDTVSVTLDEDGNAASITVMSMEMGGQGGDNSSFYGVGAAVLATDGTAYVKDGSVTTDAAGGAGLFAYGDGTVYASDTTVKTAQDTSGGVHVAGGGTLYGWNLDVETNGESSAAIRSDRGGGTMVIDGGNYVSNGVGSPAIYSTADIAVSNATLTANGSEAVCIEGLNSIHLYDCDLTGNMSDLDQNDNTWTVILYQSMSGDSEVGNSTFQMDGGSLTSENGGVFYTTNTESTITLNNVDINYNDENEFFLQCTGNTNQRGWGQSGANGADCHFTGISQDMQGNVIWDSISDLDFYLTDGSSLTGAVVDDESYAGEGGEGYCNVYVSADSTWTVIGDSTVSSLENEGTIVDSNGKTVTIQGTDGTVYVQGDSEYTITTGSYSDTADLSGATAIQDQSVYTIEKPDQL